MDNFPLLPRLGLLAAYTALSIAVIIATAQRVLIRVMLNYKGFLYNARKPTLGMKLWFMIMRLLVGKRRHSLYNFQSVLPSLWSRSETASSAAGTAAHAFSHSSADSSASVIGPG